MGVGALWAGAPVVTRARGASAAAKRRGRIRMARWCAPSSRRAARGPRLRPALTPVAVGDREALDTRRPSRAPVTRTARSPSVGARRHGGDEQPDGPEQRAEKEPEAPASPLRRRDPRADQAED